MKVVRRVAGHGDVPDVFDAKLQHRGAAAPQFVGLLLYRFDVNVRASLVLGLVGAGGIGFLINQSIKLFQFDRMLTQILIVLVVVVAVDNVSALLRKRVT